MNNYPNLTLVAHKSESYVPRTWHNASSGDVTLALAVDLTTAGEKLTKKAAGEKYIGFQLNDETQTLDVSRQLYKKMKSLNAKSLNVAGNGIYTLCEYGCSQDFINLFVYEVISKVHEHHKIEKIFTGGQSGVDMAGAITGIKLGIPVEITFPAGFKQRFEDRKDIIQTQEDIINQIDFRLANLNEALNPSPSPRKPSI
jgi:hypothetical protein